MKLIRNTLLGISLLEGLAGCTTLGKDQQWAIRQQVVDRGVECDFIVYENPNEKRSDNEALRADFTCEFADNLVKGSAYFSKEGQASDIEYMTAKIEGRGFCADPNNKSPFCQLARAHFKMEKTIYSH